MVMLYFAEGRSMVVGHYDIAKSCFVSVCLPFQCSKISKYGVFSGPYFPAFGRNTER